MAESNALRGITVRGFRLYSLTIVLASVLISIYSSMKTILFNKILDAVAEATEVSRDLVISRSKQRDVVEARSLLFHYL